MMAADAGQKTDCHTLLHLYNDALTSHWCSLSLLSFRYIPHVLHRGMYNHTEIVKDGTAYDGAGVIS